MNVKETKENIIRAGAVAVTELIKIAKAPIVDNGDDLSADKLRSAAATKKLAIFDAFEILKRIEDEENLLNDRPLERADKKAFGGFAEGRSKSK